MTPAVAAACRRPQRGAGPQSARRPPARSDAAVDDGHAKARAGAVLLHSKTTAGSSRDAMSRESKGRHERVSYNSPWASKDLPEQPYTECQR